jgi:acetyl-CoA/propionyl-CoA carboxylase biotin carboxyl carrier protein
MAALAIAVEAGYVGAGTAEFLLAPDGTFRFLEMNARLQVEHPVTEAVTGVDLVHAQLAVAAGHALPVTQADVTLRGHAIEARLYAEDPADGFLPTGGRVERLDLPSWPGVRVDTALRVGDRVTSAYDPLLAKVIAHAADRPTALARLRAALEQIVVLGVVTNLGFLLDVLGHPDVVAGEVGTDWVADVWRADPPPLPDGVVAIDADPRDPWLAYGKRAPLPTGVVAAGGWAQFRGWAYRLDDDLDPVALPPPSGSLTAPMPASVVRVDVSPGDRVAEGHVLMVLEAMKMQVQIRTPTAGAVVAIHVGVGDVVAAGQVLVEVDPS